MDPKVAGSWRKGNVSTRVGGTWRSVSEMWTRVGGVWRKFYDTISFPPGTKLQFRATTLSSSTNGVTTRQVTHINSDETDAPYWYSEFTVDQSPTIWNWCNAKSNPAGRFEVNIQSDVALTPAQRTALKLEISAAGVTTITNVAFSSVGFDWDSKYKSQLLYFNYTNAYSAMNAFVGKKTTIRLYV